MLNLLQFDNDDELVVRFGESSGVPLAGERRRRRGCDGAVCDGEARLQRDVMVQQYATLINRLIASSRDRETELIACRTVQETEGQETQIHLGEAIGIVAHIS